MNKMKVVISRRWTNPEITVAVTDEEISMVMPLTDFVKALAAEVGSPAFILTSAALQEKLQIASTLVCEEMKLATKQVL